MAAGAKVREPKVRGSQRGKKGAGVGEGYVGRSRDRARLVKRLFSFIGSGV